MILIFGTRTAARDSVIAGQPLRCIRRKGAVQIMVQAAVVQAEVLTLARDHQVRVKTNGDAALADKTVELGNVGRCEGDEALARRTP
jgi:hypothetical protein